MDWKTFGHIADILSVLGFLISLGIFRKIYAKALSQKENYKEERLALACQLRAIQANIWYDNMGSLKTQDDLQEMMFEYQLKYILISSPRCTFHAFRCARLLNNGIDPSNSSKIRQDINFIIARLSKKE